MAQKLKKAYKLKSLAAICVNIICAMLIIYFCWYIANVDYPPFWILSYMFISITGLLSMWILNRLLFKYYINRQLYNVLEACTLITCINLLISRIL